MKKYPYVKEYSNESISGIALMKEQCSFMASKMMDIEDLIDISFTNTVEDLLEYKSIPVNQPVRKSLSEKMYLTRQKYSYDFLKMKHVTLTEDTTQKTSDTNFLTNWIFTLDTQSLLKDYLYHEFIIYNKNKAFVEIGNLYPNIDVTQLVKDYIDENIVSKYRFKTFNLFVEYKNLKDNSVKSLTNNVLDRDFKLYEKNPVFDIKALLNDKGFPKDRKAIEVISIKPYTDGVFHITYKQQSSSKLKTFIYYFNVLFEKI